MRISTGQIILIIAALVLGIVRAPLPTAAILWVATAGIVLAIEKLWRRKGT